MWEISPRVNSPKNDHPSLWEPVHAASTQTTTHELELLREQAGLLSEIPRPSLAAKEGRKHLSQLFLSCSRW
jgi:hypothetical protein